MAKGRQSDQWNHTADLLCAVHRAWFSGEWIPSDFHPDTMAENVGSGKPVSSFDARIYAIQLCGPDAIEKFRQADEQRARCRPHKSKQAG